MVEVSPLHLQHPNQFVVLLEYLVDADHALLVAPVVPPGEVGILVAHKTQDFEERSPIVLNEGAREVVDRNCQEVGVEVPVDVVNRVGQHCGRNWTDSQVGQH